MVQNQLMELYMLYSFGMIHAEHSQSQYEYRE